MTSGSSGKKLNVLLDHKIAALYRLMQLRQLIEIGYKPWYHAVYVRYGPPVTKLAIQKFGLLRRSYLPLEWSPEKQLSKLIEIKPQILNAYPSVLYLLARIIKPDQAKKIGLKFVLSNSELLTDTARHTIEDAFHCKVYDDYSCLEFSAIGFECSRQNLHVASDNVIVEILDKMGRPLPPGEKGRIIITSLHNYSMPYIRYEIGDVGILSQNRCPCGRTFPYFQSILGRSDDFVTKPNGSLVDPQTIVFQIETIGDVKEFQILQDVDYHLTVNVVLHENGDFAEVSRKIRQNLFGVLQDNIKVDVIEVSSLERGTTGKHRSVISKIASS
jgi:phenylacetate-CoA ligase